MSYLDEEPEPQSAGQIAVRVISAAAGFGFSYIAGVAAVVVLIFAGIGAFIGLKLRDRAAAGPKWISVLAWLNLVSWLLPILGGLTGGITLVTAEHMGQRKRLYFILGGLGLLLGLANAALAEWTRMNGPLF